MRNARLTLCKQAELLHRLSHTTVQACSRRAGQHPLCCTRSAGTFVRDSLHATRAARARADPVSCLAGWWLLAAVACLVCIWPALALTLATSGLDCKSTEGKPNSALQWTSFGADAAVLFLLSIAASSCAAQIDSELLPIPIVFALLLSFLCSILGIILLDDCSGVSLGLGVYSVVLGAPGLLMVALVVPATVLLVVGAALHPCMMLACPATWQRLLSKVMH